MAQTQRWFWLVLATSNSSAGCELWRVLVGLKSLKLEACVAETFDRHLGVVPGHLSMSPNTVLVCDHEEARQRHANSGRVWT